MGIRVPYRKILIFFMSGVDTWLLAPISQANAVVPKSLVSENA